ncbi:MAG: hypothetical protein V2I54_01360 [Bacteroidales bacterium]|jgi:hypothetical protein|nr:hypothetical protein [Bacteroidales bacterium]
MKRHKLILIIISSFIVGMLFDNVYDYGNFNKKRNEAYREWQEAKEKYEEINMKLEVLEKEYQRRIEIDSLKNIKY